MKKLTALLLACLLVACALPALAEFDEHITFSASYIDRGTAVEDDMYHFFMDRFNADVEMMGIPWSAFMDTNSVMIIGGTMYDCQMISADYGTYISYVEQGLIKPLPDDYETRYPNIAAAIDASGFGDYINIDGKVYTVPQPIYFHFAPADYFLKHQCFYYRADWASELGFEWDANCTLSEFESYLKECIDNDMAGNGQTIGLCSAAAVNAYMDLYNDLYASFKNVDGEYVWGPQLDGVLDGIKAMKTAYNDGLIDPDFYAYETFAAQNMLPAGLCAATYQTGITSNYQLILDAARTAGMEAPETKIKPIVVTDENGVWHGGEQKNCVWLRVFNPNLDDKKFDRILSVLDYMNSAEAEEVFNMGIKGVDWDVDANGGYVSLLPDEYQSIRDKYASGWFWRDIATCLDEFDLVNPTYSKTVLDNVNAVYAFRYASAEQNGYTPFDYNIEFLSGEAKQNYSVDIASEITRLVCDKTIAIEDVDAQWEAFIEMNKGLWQPVVEDLNQIIER